MSELFVSKYTDDRSTILVYDVDWGCHWGVAINTCVIPLLPQSVNRAGGVRSWSGMRVAYNRDIALFKPALNVYVSAC